MERTRNLNSAACPPIVGDTLENNPSKAVEISAVLLDKHEDFAGFSEACKNRNVGIPKERSMGGNNTSTEESPTKKESLIEEPKRMSLGTEYIKASDICYKTENTAQAVKEFSNTENNAQSYNVQEKQTPQIYRLNLSKSITSDHTDANKTKIQQSQWCLSEDKTGVDDSCFQTHCVCTQVTTAANVLDLPQDTLVDCREWTLPKEDREVEENKDTSFSPGSNAVSSLNDLMLSVGSEGNIPNSEKQEPDSYAMEKALSLVRRYISELERVANNIEKILLSDSSQVEMIKKDRSKLKVSFKDPLVEF